jgi:hypothetical protein
VAFGTGPGKRSEGFDERNLGRSSPEHAGSVRNILFRNGDVEAIGCCGYYRRIAAQMNGSDYPVVLAVAIRAQTADFSEVGAAAATFPSAKHLASWIGVCPGEEEIAGISTSTRSPKRTGSGKVELL